MRTAGLRLDQAPPLAIPAAFFLMVPLAALAAGAVLLYSGAEALSSSWTPATIALTHLGTLGLLTMGMMGALYQMTPVVAGAPVAAVRLSWGVLAAMGFGVAALTWGVGTGAPAATRAALPALLVGAGLFAVQVGVGLARAPGGGATPRGMKVALGSFCLVVSLGLWMALGHASGRFPGPRLPWIQVHLSLGLLGWVGGLLTSVSWQILPMFYMAPATRPRLQSAILGGVVLGVGAALTGHVLAAAGGLGEASWARGDLLPLLAAPAALAVWLAHPILVWRGLGARRRRRADGSLLFWRAGALAGPATLAAGAAAWLLPAPGWTLAFGWLAIWGWAGATLHGMLTRIVPFLVWFHRFSDRVGLEDTPSMKQLLPARHIQFGFIAHQAALAAGLLAIASGADLAARATGGLMVATALILGSGLLRALSWGALSRPGPRPGR